MDSLVQDIRYALRGIRRAPGFSLVVILTLAIAIGATTAIFGVVNAVLLRSLPYPQPDRVVLLYEAIPGAISGPIGFSAPDFAAFEQRARSFEAVAAYGNKEFELSGVDQPDRVTALRASAALFDALGVQPGARARFHAGGGHRPASGRRPWRRPVAAQIRRGPGRARPISDARPALVHDRRRHAARVRVPQSRYPSQQRARRSVCADQLHRLRADRVPKHVQQQRRRTAEGRGDGRGRRRGGQDRHRADRAGSLPGGDARAGSTCRHRRPRSATRRSAASRPRCTCCSSPSRVSS